jgi:hypothetical protein
LHSVRQRAALVGCDAVIVSDAARSVGYPPTVAYQGSCVVYTDAPSAFQPPTSGRDDRAALRKTRCDQLEAEVRAAATPEDKQALVRAMPSECFRGQDRRPRSRPGV